MSGLWGAVSMLAVGVIILGLRADDDNAAPGLVIHVPEDCYLLGVTVGGVRKATKQDFDPPAWGPPHYPDFQVEYRCETP